MRSRAVLASALSLAPIALVVVACHEQRGGEPIPVERRAFHEVAPPELSFRDRPDAEVPDAAVPVDAAAPPVKHEPKRDGGVAWASGRPGYLEQLASEWRKLRPLPLSEYEAGHSKGRKHAVMIELGRLLVNASRATVLGTMGRPDGDERSGSSGWGPTARQDGRAAERLIYSWRGMKDYLFFELDASGHVLRSEWVLSRE